MAMRLRVATPLGPVVDEPISALRAEDESGSFGLRPGHEPLVAPLVTGVVVYRTAADEERFLAVRRGLLLMRGDEVVIVTRDAVLTDHLADLEEHVVERFIERDEEERTGNTALTKMRIAALRQLVQFEDVRGRAPAL
jgi:F-type H+-transporting ATPase subunit epsilon